MKRGQLESDQGLLYTISVFWYAWVLERCDGADTARLDHNISASRLTTLVHVKVKIAQAKILPKPFNSADKLQLMRSHGIFSTEVAASRSCCLKKLELVRIGIETITATLWP